MSVRVKSGVVLAKEYDYGSDPIAPIESDDFQPHDGATQLVYYATASTGGTLMIKAALGDHEFLPAIEVALDVVPGRINAFPMPAVFRRSKAVFTPTAAAGTVRIEGDSAPNY